MARLLRAAGVVNGEPLIAVKAPVAPPMPKTSIALLETASIAYRYFPEESAASVKGCSLVTKGEPPRSDSAPVEPLTPNPAIPPEINGAYRKLPVPSMVRLIGWPFAGTTNGDPGTAARELPPPMRYAYTWPPVRSFTKINFPWGSVITCRMSADTIVVESKVNSPLVAFTSNCKIVPWPMPTAYKNFPLGSITIESISSGSSYGDSLISVKAMPGPFTEYT